MFTQENEFIFIGIVCIPAKELISERFLLQKLSWFVIDFYPINWGDFLSMSSPESELTFNVFLSQKTSWFSKDFFIIFLPKERSWSSMISSSEIEVILSSCVGLFSCLEKQIYSPQSKVIFNRFLPQKGSLFSMNFSCRIWGDF